MKSHAILQSSLLDIIFENRNKDYGAYLLRKNYNKRLGTAVLVSVALFILLSFVLMELFKPGIREEIIYFKSDGANLSYIPKEPDVPTEIHNIAPAKKNRFIEAPPVISDDKNINKPVATEKIEFASNTTTTGDGIPFPPGTLGSEDGKLSERIQLAPALDPVKKDRATPVENADVMPQYPGGIDALLAFLKKNIKAPADVDDGEVVAVKIKFVINYEGKIISFLVVDSGGFLFDDEVIRVLKKMPEWIPGKNKGENVSVFYYLPVKFTSVQ
ncbi:MAG: energy transducer TonB [Ginsengibacter sp.]